ncbi:MAG: hypothetical protein NC191_02175 [Muribaculaceae bacterium]|nr:hypothetical protein [Muribaculaceae bacterium]
MKKLLSLFMSVCFILSLFSMPASALETVIEGRGVAALTGYDIGATRNQEDKYMSDKSHNSKTEFMHTQQIKEANRQAEKRKKEDNRISQTVRSAVVTTARERADLDAINILIKRTLGADALDNPEVSSKLNELCSQVNTFANKTYTGEVIDNNYIAKVKMTVDDAEFRELISDLGLAINTAQVRSKSILIVMDEFFAAPSDMHSNVLTREVTTYDYKYNEKDKQTTKASAKYSDSEKSAAGYSGYYGAAGAKSVSNTNASLNYGNYKDYSKNESEFFQNIKEYAPRNPVAQNINLTKPELVKALKDIRTIDEQMFKSKYFKGRPISSDQLQNSEELVKYIKFAQEDAKADYFGIGVSYITDRGVHESTGERAADGVVFMVIYSTQDGNVIASGEYHDSALGNTADDARAKVANKIGNGLGNELSKQIQKYYNKRNMYGNEYIVEIRGNFLPIERININKAVKNTAGIDNVVIRNSDNTKIEYVLNYKGKDAIGDCLFMQLIDVSAKFNNYNYNLKDKQIIFEPLKGTETL